MTRTAVQNLKISKFIEFVGVVPTSSRITIMSNSGNFKCLLLAVMITIFGTLVIRPQQPDNKNSNDDTKSKLTKAKSEPNTVVKNWAETGAPYIITQAEKDAYKRLKTDEERENFITAFWQRRNPDPDSDVNEYREQYYERIAYANVNFASWIPGWRTDR